MFARIVTGSFSGHRGAAGCRIRCGVESGPFGERDAASRAGRGVARFGMVALRRAGHGREGSWATVPLRCRRWMGLAVSPSGISLPGSSVSVT